MKRILISLLVMTSASAMAQVAESAYPYIEKMSDTSETISRIERCYLVTQKKTEFSVTIRSETLESLGHTGEFKRTNFLPEEIRFVGPQQCQQQQRQQQGNYRQIQQGSAEWNLEMLKGYRYQISMATTDVDARLVGTLSQEQLLARKLEIRGYEWVSDLISRIRERVQRNVRIVGNADGIMASSDNLYCIIDYRVGLNPIAACYLMIP